MENNIDNNMNNIISDKNNDNNQNKEKDDISNKKEEKEKTPTGKKKIKYRMNFSVIIEKLRNDSDIKQNLSENEFKNNLLLMSSEINQSNKISCLALISFINYVKQNTLYLSYLNKKTVKYLKSQKGIESFIYIRTLYRAAYLLNDEKNYFYAKKYINEADTLSKNSKIDAKSQLLLNELKVSIEENLIFYESTKIKRFQDIESSDNLTEEKYNKLKNLINVLLKNKYELENENVNDENQNEYLYLINKKWVEKANMFMKNYIHIRDNKIKNKYFFEVFDKDYMYDCYFDNNEKYKDKIKYAPFPGLIDNYNITNWTDFWNEPLNEDENNYIQPKLEYIKDYYLLKKQDFEFLEYFFGVTNVIKRKKNCMDFVTIKAIILDKRFKQKDYIYLLRRRNLQVRKILCGQIKKRLK
jgi:hypothetical protein